MMDGEFPDIASLSRGAAECVDRICDRFEAAWEAGGSPDLAEYLEGVERRQRPPLFAELLAVELGRRARRGHRPGPAEYLMRFPAYPELIAAAFADSEGAVPWPAGAVGRWGDDTPAGGTAGPSLPAPARKATPPSTHTDPGDDRRPMPADPQVARLLRKGLLGPPTRPGALARLDRYEVLGEVGAGGMGLVLRGLDTDSGAEVAIKLLRPELEPDPRIVAQFLREARHMQHLDHPHVLKVLGVFESPGCHYYIMPYLAAGSLGDRIRAGPPLDKAAILRVARHVATALAYAHGHGIIHRDLKPANVLMGAGQEAYLADFGLLRTLDNDSLLVLESSHCVGTPQYMSPAVAAGEAEDGRCDIYSLGAVLREMLTGRPPYEGRSSHELLRQITTTPPEPLRAVRPGADPGLARIAEWAMARQLRDRYAQMADVVTDLDRVAEGKPPLGPTGRDPGRRRWVFWSLAACMLASGGLGAWPRRGADPGKATPPPSPPPVVRFVDVEIEHSRPNDRQEDVRLGTLDQDPGRPILENDSVLIRARLGAPAYAYVIALHPNGESQLYYPDRDDTPPPIARDILAPAEKGGQVYRFPLTDGIGLQAIVLLASDRPLPPYRDWIATVRPSLPWRRSAPVVEGVWFNDGVQTRRLDTPPPPTRGPARPSSSPEPPAFAQACRVLARRPEVRTIRAWAFPVLPADGRDRPTDVAHDR